VSVGGLQVYFSHLRPRVGGVRRQEQLVIVVADAVCACRPTAETDSVSRYPKYPVEIPDMDCDVIEGRLAGPIRPEEALARRQGDCRAPGQGRRIDKPISRKAGYGRACSELPLGWRIDLLC
jgi:hypothetical protein